MLRLLFFVILTFQYLPVWAQPTSTSKPWTYWWWMGSAVTKEDISAQLQYFSKSGLGGVHIIPIYGVKGYESRQISFLSPPWLDMMKYTIGEGRRLGLGVDMTTGTGWPFGGPNVTTELAAKGMSFQNGNFIVDPTKQKVKRAAPGGEGFVLDPFHPTAMASYLTRFDSAFKNVREKPRSMYMDSYEAYGANWTDDFQTEFRRRRGYELKEESSKLADSTRNMRSDLVRIDYQQTLSELLLERYAKTWTQWSTKQGFLTRYQAHGSPGNLLDLYAAADIPETESFGTSRFKIPGLRIDPDYSIEQFGTPDPLAMKFASSAANLTGKKLVSSETGTWLANHFKVSLSQIKPQIDELFTAGINHIFYHGTNFSPVKENFPGWLFYASTDFGPSSHFAGQFSLLNKYVEECQALLQKSVSDNDVLLYFPIHDLWASKAKSAGNVHLLEVHHVDRWLLDLPFGKLATKLWKGGFTFDYVSDQQLQKLLVDKNGNIVAGKSVYKTLLIPASTYMPDSTLNRLKLLANEGGNVIFEQKLPSWTTGYHEHARRQIQFKTSATALLQSKRLKVSESLEKDLSTTGVRKERMVEEGLTFIRKKTGDNRYLYFVANLSDTFREGWIPLSAKGNFYRFDPLQGKSKLLKRTTNATNEIYLSLPPGESCFLISGLGKGEIKYSPVSQKESPIEGEWAFKFLEGMPALSKNVKMQTLKSWTTLGDSAEYFSGKGHYTIRFDISDEILNAKMITLDLGDVRESAVVKMNGVAIGTAWHIPFQLTVKPNILKSKNNVLEVEVNNLSANYMRLRDKQSPDWKKFYDINIVDITYKKFDASKWEPMPSGLLGPVKLLYR